MNERTASLTQKIHLDKFVHAGIFTVFTVLWLRTRPAGRTSHLWILLVGTALAAITEAVQNLPIINREGEFEDAMADFAGVLFGFPAVPLDRTEVAGMEHIEIKMPESNH